MSTRPDSRAASITPSASCSERASGFSTKQCFPAASTRVASSACVGTGVATTIASSASSASRSSSSVVVRADGNAAPQRSSASPDASQSQRELGVGQSVEVAGEVRAPVAEADHPDGRHRRTRFGASK